MPVPPFDDRALEALLSGAPSAQSGFDWLLPFVEDLGVASSRPVPVVRPALVMFLANGISTEKGELPATAASNVTGPAPQAAGLPKWRKKKMLISELLAGLATKLGGLGMAAKAGMGLTLAAASTTAAGAAGVLPAPAQHAVATVVASATPFSFPDTANSAASVGAKAATDATKVLDATVSDATKTVTDATKTVADATKTVTDVTKTATGGAAASSQAGNHGACVSAFAGDKSATVDGNHGKAVSAVAKSDCGKTMGGDTSSSTTPTTVGSTTSTTVSGATGATSSGSNGKGKGNSTGKANSSRND